LESVSIVVVCTITHLHVHQMADMLSGSLQMHTTQILVNSDELKFKFNIPLDI